MKNKSKKSESSSTEPIEELFQTNADVKKENILTLDIATITGFCNHTASGVWHLAPKKDESKGMRLIKFRSKLKDMLSLMTIKLIVFEGLAIYTKFPNFVAAEMVGVLKIFCEENHIEYFSVTPSELKKFATGKGGAKKEVMIQRCIEKYNITPHDDNEADAVHLFHYALNELGLEENIF